MKNGDINDENIQASSYQNYDGYTFYGFYGRLHGNDYWWASLDEEAPWLQADIGYPTNITGVVTQGDGGGGSKDDWVTSLKVSTFSQNTSDEEIFIKNENGTDMVSK